MYPPQTSQISNEFYKDPKTLWNALLWFWDVFNDPRILKVEIIVEHSIPIQRKPKHPKEKLSPSSIKWAGKMDIVKTGVSKKSKFK